MQEAQSKPQGDYQTVAEILTYAIGGKDFQMHIYLVSRNDHADYDEYDSFVVIADSEQQARETHPSPSCFYSWSEEKDSWVWSYNQDPDVYASWPKPSQVRVRHLGVTDSDQHEIVCASFNAG